MTTYLYETIPSNKSSKPKRFEIRQKMTDPALRVHPDTGEPVRRVVTGGFGIMKSGAARAAPAPACHTGACGCC